MLCRRKHTLLLVKWKGLLATLLVILVLVRLLLLNVPMTRSESIRMSNHSATSTEVKNPLALDDPEAEHKFSVYCSKDPFPCIAPALLNSADIYDYVAATGMIHPFDPGKLKPASYEMSMEGKFIQWDKNNREQHFTLEEDGEFVLEKNSI